MSSSPTKNNALDSPLRRALEQPPLKRFRVSCYCLSNCVFFLSIWIFYSVWPQLIFSNIFTRIITWHSVLAARIYGLDFDTNIFSLLYLQLFNLIYDQLLPILTLEDYFIEEILKTICWRENVRSKLIIHLLGPQHKGMR